MKVGDLYRFNKPLQHYIKEFEGKYFVITKIRQDGRGDTTVLEVKLIDNPTTWAFTIHELAYIAQRVK